MLATLRILHRDGKESQNSKFNQMRRLGLVTLEYVILESCKKMIAFQIERNKLHIQCGYGYIWQSNLALLSLVFFILELMIEEPWKDWSFGIGKWLFVVHTNDIYDKLVQDRAWFTNKGVWIHCTLLGM